MLFALAMMAQDVPLNADAAEAVACGRAVVAAPGEGPSGIMHALYFMMTAAAAHPSPGKSFVDRSGELAEEVFNGKAPAANDVPAILKRCDARYPLARSNAAVKLPADPFQRDVMCAASASYVLGIFQGAKLDEMAKPYERIQQAYLERMPDTLLAQHGMNDQASVGRALDDALRNTLRIGNLDAVTQACTRALDGK